MIVPFLQRALETWSGVQGREFVFELYSFHELADAQALKSSIEPMEAKVLRERTGPSLSDLLGFYKLLLRRWSISLMSAEAVSEVEGAALKGLMDRANDLCLSLITAAPTTATHFAILDFYEQFTALFSVETVVLQLHLVNLPTAVVYSLLFSQSLSVVSRLCGVLTAYKLAWESVTSRAGRQLTPQERQDVGIFNGFLMDVCNCLWRARAFSYAEPNAQGCAVPAEVVQPLSDYIQTLDSGLVLNTAFTLSYSPSICLQSIAYVRSLEEEELAKADSHLLTRHAGPVTQDSLVNLSSRGGLHMSWQDYRTGVLLYLRDWGVAGIPDLMHNTMRHLMQKT
jgi:centromere protein I